MQKINLLKTTQILTFCLLLGFLTFNFGNYVLNYFQTPTVETQISDVYALSSYINKPSGVVARAFGEEERQELLEKHEGNSLEYHKERLEKEPAPELNKQEAIKDGFSPYSVDLMDQMLEYNQAIQIAGLESQNVLEGAKLVNLDDYPLVKDFFEKSRTKDVEKIDLTKTSRSQLGGVNAQALQIFSEFEGMKECGYYDNPMPDRAQDYYTHGPFDDAEKVIRSWGYHPPIAIDIEGWTRTVTWNESVCGDGTFRDNAGITKDGRHIVEQNYEGWMPRGEPNPEVYASMVWPYTIWPAYVAWWHDEY